MNNFILLLGTYLILGTLIALLVRRAKQTQEEYFVGGRMIGGLVSAGTYAATTYSGFMMVGLVGMAYQTGIGAMIFELCYLASTMILLSIYGKKVWELGRSKGLISPMELFSERFGAVTTATGTVIALIALIPYTASQVISLALVFQSFGKFDFAAGAAFATVIIGLWALIGGLRGVAVTDALQGLFMIAVALAGFSWAAGRFQGLTIQRFPSSFWTPARFINLTLPWVFFALTNPQVMQRLFIPKDRKALRRMILLFGLFGLLYTLIVTMIGFMARYGTEHGLFASVADRDRVTIELFGPMGRSLALALALSIIFAAVTTANSIILTLSSMVTRDLFRERSRVWVGRGLILVLTLLVFLFSLTRPAYIVELSVASSSILLCYLPLLFGIFHGKRGGPVTGVLTLVCGAVTAVVLGAAKVPLSSVYTLAVSCAVYFCCVLIERSKA